MIKFAYKSGLNMKALKDSSASIHELLYWMPSYFGIWRCSLRGPPSFREHWLSPYPPVTKLAGSCSMRGYIFLEKGGF